MGNKKAFTLIELLIVIAIIGILASLILPNFIITTDRAKQVKTETLIHSIALSLENYREHIDPQGFYPESSAEQDGFGTTILVDKLKDSFQFADDQLSEDKPWQLVDGWLTPMRYIPWRGKSDSEKINGHNKRTYDLWSAGQDMDFETQEDNFTNWASKLEDVK